MIPDLDLQRMRDHDETCDRLAPEGYKHCPHQYGVQAIFDRNRLLKELDLLSTEGKIMREALEYIDRPSDDDLTGDNARAMIVCAHDAIATVSGTQK